jgi:hypothetical protein
VVATEEVRVTGRRDLEDLADALAAARWWPATGACVGTNTEFVDVDAETAEYVVRRFCHHCNVVGSCRELGDRGAPYPWRSVFGGVVFEPRQRAPRFITRPAS